MSFDQILSWTIGAIGILGFYLAGKKVWWSWYINLGCQTLWFTYAIVTSTPAFAVTALFYTFVFGNNARIWTKDYISKKKVASGNLSEKRDRRRTPIHWWPRKWHEPRNVGEQQRTTDGVEGGMAGRAQRHAHDYSRASKTKDLRLP